MKTTFEHKFNLKDKVFGFIASDIILEGFVTKIEFSLELDLPNNEGKHSLQYYVQSPNDIAAYFQESELFTSKEELLKHYKL